MPAKKQPQESKKSNQKKKEKMIEDKTFGLKNKNKSKKVQQQIKQVENNIKNSGDPKMRKLEEQRKQAKAAAKARKAAAKQEQDALFNEALMAVQKKTSTKVKGTVEAKGRDAAEEEEKKSGGTSRAMKLMYQMDAKEIEERMKQDPNYVPTLEDELEAQRQKKLRELKESGKKGTPITEETFNKWLAAKKQKRALEAKKAVEAEMRKKKGGKGLSVLSGRDLYTYDKNLFVDDLDAVDENTLKEENNETNDDAEKTEAVTQKFDEQLFLEEEDDDLDDLIDDDDDE